MITKPREPQDQASSWQSARIGSPGLSKANPVHPPTAPPRQDRKQLQRSPGQPLASPHSSTSLPGGSYPPRTVSSLHNVNPTIERFILICPVLPPLQFPVPA
ncbi:hypothetical protein ATANTOWER_009484 [Ataeniobius toweri]|uniref:Uncharacterized protein n=1 Tax=Ataeniobius toweri TaxID=208326 RepID=A0ABU7B405_9TELE|nr:hypothetical protein [Ataeniobius toweri]